MKLNCSSRPNVNDFYPSNTEQKKGGGKEVNIWNKINWRGTYTVKMPEPMGNDN